MVILLNLLAKRNAIFRNFYRITPSNPSVPDPQSKDNLVPESLNMLNRHQGCIVILVLLRLEEELGAAQAQRGALQNGGNHLKEADASACPCDVDLAKVASHHSGGSIDVTRCITQVEVEDGPPVEDATNWGSAAAPCLLVC